MTRNSRARLAQFLASLGIDPFRLRSQIQRLRAWPATWRHRRQQYGHYFADYAALSAQYEASGREFPIVAFSPELNDRFSDSGSGLARGHYFEQDLLVAQWVFADRPDRHVDIGSRIDGFVAHVASFRELEVFDIRPQPAPMRNVRFRQADLMADDPALHGYTPSLSCLHTLEHFGLGRYGDPVDYYGYRRGWENLHRMVQPSGRLYFAVPIGPQRIEFNSQRIFSLPQLSALIDPLYTVERFAYVDDAGALVENANLHAPEAARNHGCFMGCGIFALRRKG